MTADNKQRIVGIIVLVAFIALLVPFLFTGGSRHRDTLEHGSEIELPLSNDVLGGNKSTEQQPPSAQKISPRESQVTNEEEYQKLSLELSGPREIENSTNNPETSMHNLQSPSSEEIKPMATNLAIDAKVLEPNSVDRVTVAGVKKVAGAGTKKKISRKTLPNKFKISVDGGNWFVQVGSFSNAERVKRLADRLQSNGFLVYFQKIVTSQGPMTRVLVGKEKSQEEAMAIARKLKSRLQLDGKVIISNL